MKEAQEIAKIHNNIAKSINKHLIKEIISIIFLPYVLYKGNLLF